MTENVYSALAIALQLITTDYVDYWHVDNTHVKLTL